MKLPNTGPSLTELMVKEAKQLPKLLQEMARPEVQQHIIRANDEMWNWDDSRFRANLVALSPEHFWMAVKFSRFGEREIIPLLDTRGKPFTYRLPSGGRRILHEIDKNLGGMIGSHMPKGSTSEDQTRYLLTSLREEAFWSSRIEGAVATREDAKEMIRSRRKPRNESEQMILNNYNTIRFLNQKKDEPLTPGRICEVQRMLTEGTLKKEDAAGRFRREEEAITVFDDEDGQILHQPPAAKELSQRIELLCAFANADSNAPGQNVFIHPAVRAIALHFWLAYDHPFVDGNGRTARALFYWSMLRQGYWLAEYLTISSIIAQHPKQYARAYINSECDDNDLSYFVQYHLKVIERSIVAFREYIERKQAEKKSVASMNLMQFNPRQRALIDRARHDPAVIFTYESHANSHGTSVPTARADILELERKKILVGNRKGRRFEFIPAPDIHARLKKLAGSP